MVETVYFDGEIKGVNSGISLGYSKSFEEAILKLPVGLIIAKNGTLATPRYELFGKHISFPIVFIKR